MSHFVADDCHTRQLCNFRFFLGLVSNIQIISAAVDVM